MFDFFPPFNRKKQSANEPIVLSSIMIYYKKKDVKTEDIEALEIPLPSKETQQKIAAELDTIQSAIDNKKQQLALLDEAVKSEFIVPRKWSFVWNIA